MSTINTSQSHRFVATIHGETRAYRVRTVEMDHQRWFVIADVMLILGFDATRIVSRLKHSDDIRYLPIKILGGRMKNTISERPCISLGGLLEIARGSRKSTAPPFREWLSQLSA